MSEVVAVVPAAGNGERLGAGVPKALHPVGGVAMLVLALRELDSSGLLSRIVVAAPPAHLATVQALVTTAGLATPVQVLAGGATRRESVAAALAALPAGCDVVVVHDAARPFAPGRLVGEVVAAVRAGADAAVPALPVADTVKVVDPGGQVRWTLPRAELRAVQTPQAFRREVLAQAHAAAEHEATDDASLVEAVGGRVATVAGHPEAFKVTGPLDLLLAEALIAGRAHVG